MSEAAGGNGTDAPPGGDGSDKGDGGWKPPSDGSWMPKVAVDELVGRHKDRAKDAEGEVARLRAENEALKAEKVEAQAPKPISRAELNTLVADGKITQDAADAHWEQQVLDAAEKKGQQAGLRAVEGREREQTVAAQLEDYRKLVPVAWEVGSKERSRVEKEYQSLLKLGFAPTKATEVAALRAAFGDPDAIRASRSTGRNGPGETFVDVGGGDRSDGNVTDADGKPKGLTSREDAHYTNLINRGVYKDWKAVTEERKFANKAKQA